MFTYVDFCGTVICTGRFIIPGRAQPKTFGWPCCCCLLSSSSSSYRGAEFFRSSDYLTYHVLDAIVWVRLTFLLARAPLLPSCRCPLTTREIYIVVRARPGHQPLSSCCSRQPARSGERKRIHFVVSHCRNVYVEEVAAAFLLSF